MARLGRSFPIQAHINFKVLYILYNTVSVSPSVVTGTFSIPSYTPSGQIFVTVSPSVVTGTFTIPAYSAIVADENVFPAVKTATFSIPVYTITAVAHATISPSVVTGTFSILTYTALGDYWEDKFGTPSTSWSNKF